MKPAWAMCGIVIALLASIAAAAESSPAKIPPGLDTVAWEGPGASWQSLQGKTVVVMTYVTWCPICNKWAPDMLSQLKEAVKDKPVVVLAVSTDVALPEAKQYMATRGFVGQNILHGADKELGKNFGFDEKGLFNYAIIDPQGVITSTGSPGAHYTDSKKFVIAESVAKESGQGRFNFMAASMSEQLKNVLWPLELGYVNDFSREMKRAEKSLTGSDREELKKALTQFAVNELKAAQELSAGDAPQKLQALDKVAFLSASFKNSEQAKDAKKLLAELSADKNLKKEIAAKKLYDQSLQIPDPDRRAAVLQNAAKRFSDTYYGQQAAKAAAK